MGSVANVRSQHTYAAAARPRIATAARAAVARTAASGILIASAAVQPEGGRMKRRAVKDQTLLSMSERVRMAREAAGLSCAELARRVGVRPSAAVQWESPTGTRPTVESLSRIAVITKASFEWLATGRGSQDAAAGAGADTPAVAPGDFAHSPYEERLLRAGRRVPLKLRETLLTFLEQAFR
jgi:transcriptional regulator with XRE-family HTH domain